MTWDESCAALADLQERIRLHSFVEVPDKKGKMVPDSAGMRPLALEAIDLHYKRITINADRTTRPSRATDGGISHTSSQGD